MESNNKKRKPTITANESINDGLIKDSKIHTNLAQEVVVTTEDKIRICLISYLNRIGKKNGWIAPSGILLTIIITLLTSQFKDFYFSADTWTAVFIIAALLSLVWLVICLKDILISVDIDEVIDELKKGSSIEKEKSHIIYVDKENRIIRVESSGEIQNLQVYKKARKRTTRTLKIIKGVYGIIDKNVDVTDKLNGLIKDGKLVTEATNALVDSDPVPGTPKFLDVEYIIQGKRFAKKFSENEAVNLP